MATKSERIVRYTAAEIDEKLAKGESQTNWDYVRSLNDEELEASIDFEDEGEFDWSLAYPGLPPFEPKQQLTVRFDRDIVDWFKSQGSGYQTRMNAVLRQFMLTHKQEQHSSKS